MTEKALPVLENCVLGQIAVLIFSKEGDKTPHYSFTYLLENMQMS